jgi:hypothetical protein
VRREGGSFPIWTAPIAPPSPTIFNLGYTPEMARDYSLDGGPVRRMATGHPRERVRRKPMADQ